MDGSTLLEATSSPRAGPFNRPDPLKIPTATSNNEFGKHHWHSQRSIWHAPHASLSSRTSEDLTSRADSARQKSASSIHFSRPADTPSLSCIDDDSRSATKPGPSPWPFSAVTPADSRSRARLNSPTKQNNSAWHFPRDLNLSSESSFLLRNSDPDIDLAAECKPRNSFSFDCHSALQIGNLTHSARKMHGSSGEDNSTFSGATSIVHSNTNSIDSIDSSVVAMPSTGSGPKVPVIDNASPTGQRFGSSAVSIPGGGLASPPNSKFSAQGQHRDTLHISAISAPQGLPLSIEATTESFKNLVMSSHSSRAPLPRGTSALFLNSDTTAGPMNLVNHAATNGPLPQLRLNADPASFQPGVLANLMDAADTNTLLSLYSATWAANAPGTPQSTDFRSGGSLQYYSSGATPSTNRDSGPSANGSGLSSRSSSFRDFTLVDRKPGNLDSLQSTPHTLYSSTGVPAIAHHHPYEFPLNPNVRMNPLAGAYTPYGVSAFNLSGVSSYAVNSRIASREQESSTGRSPALEDFRLHHKTNKRYELRDIFGYVVEFSGDQHGSRFIQQKLETANSDEKDQIFKEIQTNCLQLMTDVFGNYVIQKLFEHGNQAQKKSLANHMKGHVLALSTQMYGCRVVQKALEHVLTDQQASLVKELDGPNKQILKVIRDQNGNHVVQKAIERVPAEHIRFIIEAHRGEAVKLATHTYGCRVIQRILENCDMAAKRIVLEELYTCITPLITDAFGNYVVQHIIEKGDLEGRRRVVSMVLQQVLNFSKHKFASNVVEKCIDNADPDQRTEIFRRLVGPNEQGQTPVLGLLRDQYGNYVIQKVHSWLQGADLDALVNEIKLCLPQLKRTSYGKQVMAIEKLLYGMAGTSDHPATPNPTTPGRHVTSSCFPTDHPRTPRQHQEPGRRIQQVALFPTVNTFQSD